MYYHTDSQKEAAWEEPTPSNHYVSPSSAFSRSLLPILFKVVLLLTFFSCKGKLKYDGTRSDTRFRLSAKRTSTFKSAGASVQSTTGSRGVRISGSNAGHTMFRGSVKSTGYTLHSPFSPSSPLPHVTVCHDISTGAYSC